MFHLHPFFMFFASDTRARSISPALAPP